MSGGAEAGKARLDSARARLASEAIEARGTASRCDHEAGNHRRNGDMLSALSWVFLAEAYRGVALRFDYWTMDIERAIRDLASGNDMLVEGWERAVTLGKIHGGRRRPFQERGPGLRGSPSPLEYCEPVAGETPIDINQPPDVFDLGRKVDHAQRLEEKPRDLAGVGGPEVDE